MTELSAVSEAGLIMIASTLSEIMSEMTAICSWASVPELLTVRVALPFRFFAA